MPNLVVRGACSPLRGVTGAVFGADLGMCLPDEVKASRNDLLAVCRPGASDLAEAATLSAKVRANAAADSLVHFPLSTMHMAGESV